jgi:hypothetical protein
MFTDPDTTDVLALVLGLALAEAVAPGRAEVEAEGVASGEESSVSEKAAPWSLVAVAPGDGLAPAEDEPPELVAVMVAVPGLIASTSPFCETVATAGFEEVHTTCGVAAPPELLVPVTVARSSDPVSTSAEASLTLSAVGTAPLAAALLAADFAEPAACCACAAALEADPAAVAAECTTGRSTVNQSASTRQHSSAATPSTGRIHSGSVCFSSMTPSVVAGSPCSGIAETSNGRVRFGPRKKVLRGRVLSRTKVAVPGCATNTEGRVLKPSLFSGSKGSTRTSSGRLPRFSTTSLNLVERRPVALLGTRLAPRSPNSPTRTTPSSTTEPSGSSVEVTRRPYGTSPGGSVATRGGRKATWTRSDAPGRRLTWGGSTNVHSPASPSTSITIRSTTMPVFSTRRTCTASWPGSTSTASLPPSKTTETPIGQAPLHSTASIAVLRHPSRPQSTASAPGRLREPPGPWHGSRRSRQRCARPE